MQFPHTETHIYICKQATLPITLRALVTKNDNLLLMVTLKVHTLVQTLETSPHTDTEWQLPQSRKG